MTSKSLTRNGWAFLFLSATTSYRTVLHQDFSNQGWTWRPHCQTLWNGVCVWCEPVHEWWCNQYKMWGYILLLDDNGWLLTGSESSVFFTLFASPGQRKHCGLLISLYFLAGYTGRWVEIDVVTHGSSLPIFGTAPLHEFGILKKEPIWNTVGYSVGNHHLADLN